MARGQKQYTDEFKNTIVELHNSGKSLADLSSEYALAKLTIVGWINKNKPITVDKNITITAADYQAVLKKLAKIEDENDIFKKALGIFARK